MRPEDNKNNDRVGEGYGADGQRRSDYSGRGSLPEYNEADNEIIIGGSDDDADYDEYSRRLERRASKPARRPKIEYEDDGHISRRERKRAFRRAREQEAAELAAEAAAAEAAVSEAADSGEEIIIGAGDNIADAAETAVSHAVSHAAQNMQHIAAISDEAAGAVHNAASHPTIERIEDGASASEENVIEIIGETAEDAKEGVSERIEDIKDAIHDKAEAVKEKAEDIVEAVSEKAEAVKEKAEDIRETVSEKAETVKEKAEDIVEAVKEKAEDIRGSMTGAEDDIDDMDGSEVLDNLLEDTEVAAESAVTAAKAVRRARRPDQRAPEPARRVPSVDVGEEISEQVAAIKEEISGKAAQFKETISETTVQTAAAAAAVSAVKRPSRVERIDRERDILDELLGDDDDYYDEPSRKTDAAESAASEVPAQTAEDTSEPETEDRPAGSDMTGGSGEDAPAEAYAGEEEYAAGEDEEADTEEPYGDAGDEEAYDSAEDEEAYDSAEDEEAYDSAGDEDAYDDAGNEEDYDDAGDEDAYDDAGNEEDYGDAEDEEAYGEDGEDGAYEDTEEEEYYGEDEYEEAGEPEIYDGSAGDEYDGSGLPLPVVKPRNLDAVRKRREASGERSPARVPRHDLLVSASPHIHCGETTRVLMGDVIIALIPALIASVLWFGWRALMITGVCVASCVVTEFVCRRVMKRRQTVGDLSAVVTGILLAFCLPPEINPVFAVIGSVVAIAVVKQMFGGIGMNFANPAATARIVMMLSFPAAMTTWSRPFYYYLDAISEATPLSKLAEGGGELPTYAELLVGYHSGCIGETCAVALLLGGAYLLLRGVISWEIPVGFIGTVALFSVIVGQDPVYQILSGGVILGAVFMATDYVTSPVNSRGRLIFGFGCGLLTMLIRLYGNMPEGVSFAILLMNILTPHIDRLTLPVPFGEEREAA